MSQQRFHALAQVESRKPVEFTAPGAKVSDYFASNVFTWKEMREYLPADVYQALRACVDKGENISRAAADQVASVRCAGVGLVLSATICRA